MPTESTIEIHLSELAQIVESVFRTMVSLEVSESGQPWFPERGPVDSDHPFGGRLERSVGAGVRPPAGMRIRSPLPFDGEARDRG